MMGLWILAPIGVLIILRSLLLERYFPKVIWGGVAVGAMVGVILALVREGWWIVLLTSAVGLHAGLVVELILGLIEKRRWQRRFRK